MSEVRTLHEPFKAWLNKRQVPYVYHRPDQRSGIRKGWPDFTVLWMSHVCCIEFKTAKGKISPDQEACHKHIRRSGNRVVVARSVEEAIEACRNILCTDWRDPAHSGLTKGHLSECFEKLKETVRNTGAETPANGKVDAIGVELVNGFPLHRGKTEQTQIPANGYATQHFFIAKDRHVGSVVVAKDLEGNLAAIRAASQHDLATLPELTAAVL